MLIITDSSFVIEDLDTRCILFFTLEGKFIRKIKWRVNKYPILSYIKSDSQIVIAFRSVNSKNSVIKKYSLTGIEGSSNSSIIDEYSLDKISLGNGYSVSTQTCYFDLGQKPKDSIYYLVNIFKNNKLHKSFLPYNQQQKMGACAFMFSTPFSKDISKEDIVYMSPNFDYGIYKITKDTVIKLFDVTFPEQNTFSKKILSLHNLKDINSVRNTDWRNENKILGLSNIFLYKDFLFFKTDMSRYVFVKGSEEFNQYNFIYNIRTNRLNSLERIIPDASTYYLPFLGESNRFALEGLVSHNKQFYSTVSSLQMFTAFEKNKLRSPKYPVTLQGYFKTQSSKSNPVIVRMKLKE